MSTQESSAAAWRAEHTRTAVALSLFAGLTLLLYIAGEKTTAILRLEPRAILTMPWRLVTGHWVHLSWQHWLLNMATTGAFVALFPRLQRWPVFLVVAAAGTAAVDAGVLLFHGDIDWYVGFSGVAYAFVSAGAVLHVDGSPRLSLLVLGVLAGKLVRDQVLGTPAATEALVGGSVLAEAHIYGAAGGAAVAWALRARSKPAPLR